MLHQPTPFPYVGSYALFDDPDEPARGPELVRILWRSERFVTVAFPLRSGADGNKAVAADALIDASPLEIADQREFHDLERELYGRIDGAVGEDGRRTRLTARQKRLAARRDALRTRMIWVPYMAKRMRELQRLNASRRIAA